MAEKKTITAWTLLAAILMTTASSAALVCDPGFRDVTFTYYPLDVYPFEWCALYTNISGVWTVTDQTTSVNNASYDNSFTVSSIPTGKYIWNILCRNTNGVEAFVGAGNRVFTICPRNISCGIVSSGPTGDLFDKRPLVSADIQFNGAVSEYEGVDLSLTPPGFIPAIRDLNQSTGEGHVQYQPTKDLSVGTYFARAIGFSSSGVLCEKDWNFRVCENVTVGANVTMVCDPLFSTTTTLATPLPTPPAPPPPPTPPQTTTSTIPSIPCPGECDFSWRSCRPNYCGEGYACDCWYRESNNGACPCGGCQTRYTCCIVGDPCDCDQECPAGVSCVGGYCGGAPPPPPSTPSPGPSPPPVPSPGGTPGPIPAGCFDWRNKDGSNYVTSVKDQDCGDCWAHATLGVIEAAYHVEQDLPVSSNPELDLSESWLDSNCYPQGDCAMGGNFYSFTYIHNEGVVTESCWNYEGWGAHGNSCPSTCPDESAPVSDRMWTIDVDDWTSNPNVAEIKQRLVDRGPVGVYIAMAAACYASTVNGVVVCGGGGLDHAVVITGYCDDASIPGGGYWIVKNSWGSFSCPSISSPDGYFKVAYGRCGIQYIANNARGVHET